MEIFAFSLKLDLGRDWTALSFFGVLLAVLFFFFTIFAGLKSASTRMNNMLWPSILGVLGLIGIVLFSDFRKSEADSVRLSVETERLLVESGRGDAETQTETDPESEQNGSEQDSFTHSRAYEHEHDDLGRHAHDGVGEHTHD